MGLWMRRAGSLWHKSAGVATPQTSYQCYLFIYLQQSLVPLILYISKKKKIAWELGRTRILEGNLGYLLAPSDFYKKKIGRGTPYILIFG